MKVYNAPMVEFWMVVTKYPTDGCHSVCSNAYWVNSFAKKERNENATKDILPPCNKSRNLGKNAPFWAQIVYLSAAVTQK